MENWNAKSEQTNSLRASIPQTFDGGGFVNAERESGNLNNHTHP